MRKLLDGVEKELRPQMSVNSLVSLEAFRKRLNRDSVPRRRKRFQRDLNALLDSNVHLRAATKRYLRNLLRSARKRIGRAIRKADKLVEQLEADRKKS